MMLGCFMFHKGGFSFPIIHHITLVQIPEPTFWWPLFCFWFQGA